MVALPQVFKTSDLPSGGESVLIENGRYKAVIVDSDIKDTSSGTGKYLELKFVIMEGVHQNTEFFERLNIVNSNETAMQIAYKRLARISEALNMEETPQDSVQLHNKPLIIETKTEPGKPWTDKDGLQREGKDKSVIKSFHPLISGGVGSTASAPVANIATGQNKPESAPWG